MQEQAEATQVYRKPTRVRWTIVSLLFLGTTICYLDRVNLSVAAPYVQDDLGLDNFQLGLILSGFFWTYAIFQLIGGYVVDRFGARLMYAASATWWSIFTAAAAVAQGFASLFGFRLLLGAGESPAYPSNAKAVSEWFPKQERSFATGIYDSGARAGSAATAPIVAALIALVGWRGAFLVTGLLGLLWAAAWAWFYRRPREHWRASEAEVEHIEAGQDREPAHERRPRIRWIDLLRYREVWGMVLGNFCVGFVVYWFVTWFPSYLVNERGFSLLQLGIFGALPPLFAIPTGWFGGFFADRLVRRGVGLTAVRKGCIVGGLIVSLAATLSLLAPSSAVAVTLLALSYGSLTFANASIWSLPADLAPTQGYVASLAGLMNFTGTLGGLVVSGAMGALLELTGGSYVLPMLTLGGVAILGALNYLLVIRRVAPLEAQSA